MLFLFCCFIHAVLAFILFCSTSCFIIYTCVQQSGAKLAQNILCPSWTIGYRGGLVDEEVPVHFQDTAEVPLSKALYCNNPSLTFLHISWAQAYRFLCVFAVKKP